MKDCIDFLARLSCNNNREWFNSHKDEYLRHKARFDDFVTQLISAVSDFDPSIQALTPKDCTYRIYRDTRFSPDKTPYKIHMGAFIVPEGKKSGYSGYYFQIGPDEMGYNGGCMLAAGNYCIEPRVLKLLREDIALDEGKEFASALSAAPGFSLDWEDALKRTPTGYPSDRDYSDWLRLKNFCLVRYPGIDYMENSSLLERLVSDFRTTLPFLNFINRAIRYSRGL